MHKLSSLALALMIAGGVAAPALAADSGGFDSSWYVTQLQYKGINAVDANDGWNGNFRATVELADGSQVFQYFDRDSLQPVNASKGGNTRVLSRLDTGRTAAPASTDSLLIDNFFD
ncbi:MAG: hypothetical protein IPK28_13320 [Devosia sp.]|nr:hypothetical protein [Devosia sp.]